MVRQDMVVLLIMKDLVQFQDQKAEKITFLDQQGISFHVFYY